MSLSISTPQRWKKEMLPLQLSAAVNDITMHWHCLAPGWIDHDWQSLRGRFT
jgi:hypothetical protein